VIKIGFCVAYDWFLLKKSVPRVYAFADTICLAIDKNRKSWNGQKYEFDEEAFSAWLKQIDTEKKIDFYQDNFSLAELSAMENDSRQRKMMSDRLGRGGWHVQIDSDEYFVDFQFFVRALIKINPNPSGHEKPLNVCAGWVPLIKRIPTGFLYVDFKNKLPELAPFATNVPQYERARHNGHFNIIVPTYVIHETWARSDDELWFKMNNWGHSSDELKQIEIRKSYYQLWQSLDEYNCQYISNLHPAVPGVWPSLSFMPAASVEEFINTFSSPVFPLSRFQLLLKNSRYVAKLKDIVSKFIR